MTRARILLTLAAFALAPAMAQAEGFYTRDLGEGGTPEACMARAERALNAVALERANPGAIVDSGAWSVAAYNLQPGNVDVQIACPYRESHVSITLAVAHSDSEESDRITAMEAVVARWNAAGQSGKSRDKGKLDD